MTIEHDMSEPDNQPQEADSLEQLSAGSARRALEPSAILIPEAELKTTFSRSGGAGGQNVNKVNTKVTLHWSFMDSTVLTAEQKMALKRETERDGSALKKRTTSNDEIVVSSSKHRKQKQNLEEAKKVLHKLLLNALTPDKKRVKTRPPRRAKEARHKMKKYQSDKKKNRRKVDY